MSYPEYIIHRPGMHRQTYGTSATNLPYALGQQMRSHDGRIWRFALNGAVAQVAGNLYQSVVPTADHDDMVVPAAIAINSRTLSITNGGTTAITANEYKDGWISITDDVGEGYVYRIASNGAAATAAATSITLAPGEDLQVALTTATTVSLIRNRWRGVIIHPSPATAPLAGIAMTACAANTYCWMQTGGPAAVLTEGTVVINEEVIDSASTNGAVAPGVLTEATPNTGFGQNVVGTVLEVAATTEYSIIDLTIDR